MLILAKAAMAMMLGFVLAIASGLIFIPLLKKFNIGQKVSRTINERHLEKEGTPTMGGIIFIFPTIFSLILLYINKSINFSYNLFILIFVFLAYGYKFILGFFKKDYCFSILLFLYEEWR